MSDWRLTHQLTYLKGSKLIRMKYSARQTHTDHDHCELCMETFSDDGGLKCGYCTPAHYHWICEECFRDFKDLFGWTVINEDRRED